MSDIDYPSPCSVPGCDRPHLARGWCKMHYYRWYRRRDTSDPSMADGDCVAWLHAHLNHEGTACLVWPYARLRTGYGVVLFEGRMQLAGRVMCVLRHGPPPSRTHEAAHECGNGHLGCAHPDHVYWATPKQNQADRKVHGTYMAGESAPWSRLTEADVVEIRKLAQTQLQREVARQFGISRSMVGKIIARKAWAHVGGANG